MFLKGAFLYFCFFANLWAVNTVHQYYEPIEDKDSCAYLDTALVYLVKMYGKPNQPINRVHLRHSKIRKNPELITQADIFDLPQLKKTLSLFLQEKKYPTITSAIENTDQASLIKGLNALVNMGKFHLQKDIKLLGLTKEQKGWDGSGFFGCFSENLPRLNRSLLSSIFKDSLLPFKKRKGLRSGRQSCETVDKEKGIFVIYLKHKVGTEGFYSELGHEVFHLLDVDCFDWYVEGLASIFSEQFALSQGKKWGVWRQRFLQEKMDEPYAASYAMMKQLLTLRKDIFKGFMGFSINNAQTRKKLIDINAWADGLSDVERNKAKKIVEKFMPVLEKYEKNSANELKK